MINTLLLAASIANAQEASTITASIPVETQIEISNLGKDTRSLLSGRYTQTGKPTFQGGVVFSNTSGKALTFQDGTTQNTAAVSGSVHVSSTTQFTGNFTSNARTGPCIANSTVTFTLDGTQKIFVAASAQAFGIDSASVWAIAVPIIDGVLPTGYDNTTGYQAAFGITAGYRVPLNIFYLSTSAASSGNHTACLSIGTNSGSGATTTLVGPTRITAGGM